MERMQCSELTGMIVSERLKRLPIGKKSKKMLNVEEIKFPMAGNVFADPTYDNSFKFAFGGESGKGNMAGLMNAIYEELNINNQIGALEAKDRELDGSTLDEKTMHLDTFFQTEFGNLLNIEMQKGDNWEPSLLISRMKAQICRIKYPNLKIGADQQAYKTTGVVNVLITNYVLNPNWPVIVQEVIGEFGMGVADINQDEVDRIIIIQLGMFNKQIHELESDFDVYLYLLVNMGSLLEIPPQFDNDKFKPFFEKLRIKNLNNKQMNLLSKEAEEILIREYREKKGKAEGRAEGKEEGEKKMTLKFLKRLLLAGKYSLEEIANLTETSVEEVMKVKSSIHLSRIPR